MQRNNFEQGEVSPKDGIIAMKTSSSDTLPVLTIHNSKGANAWLITDDGDLVSITPQEQLGRLTGRLPAGIFMFEDGTRKFVI